MLRYHHYGYAGVAYVDDDLDYCAFDVFHFSGKVIFCYLHDDKWDDNCLKYPSNYIHPDFLDNFKEMGIVC